RRSRRSRASRVPGYQAPRAHRGVGPGARSRRIGVSHARRHRADVETAAHHARRRYLHACRRAAMNDTRNRPLRVERLVATRKGDADRGPAVYMNPADARERLLNEGELAWIYGPRRHELATVVLRDDQKLGDITLRD